MNLVDHIIEHTIDLSVPEDINRLNEILKEHIMQETEFYKEIVKRNES